MNYLHNGKSLKNADVYIFKQVYSVKLILIGLTVDGIFHVQISIPSTDIYLALIALGTRVVGGDTRARDGAPFLIKRAGHS